MKEENFDNQNATKGDVAEVKNELKVEMGTLHKSIDLLSADLQDFKQEMRNGFRDVFEAMHLFAESVDNRFDEVRGDIEDLQVRTVRIESTMVTKDYLDEKMGDLRGDMTVLIRKEDNKVKALVEVLVEKNVLNQNDQKRIFSLEPFAQ